jgi:hypothetical protein
MELKDRIIQTTMNNLMVAASLGLGGFIGTSVLPWLVSSGILQVTVVMK